MATTRTLSLCMIVRNEEENLETCLRSAKDVVDEIVIVDTGSEDRTIAIARSFGATVLEEVWADDFSTPRNHSLEAATKDWILVLAADEEIASDSGPKIRERIGATPARGLQVIVRNLMPPGETAQFTEAPQTRLFERRPEHRYEGIVHEQVAPSIFAAGGTLEATDLVVIHHGYRKDLVQGGKSRAKRNLALLEKQARSTPNDPHVLYNLGTTFKALGDLASARRALEAAARADNGSLGDSAREGLHMRLAQIALATKEDAVAVDHARKTLAFAPANPVALQVLAVGLLSGGDLAGATAAFTKLRASPALEPALAADIDKLLAQLRPARR